SAEIFSVAVSLFVLNIFQYEFRILDLVTLTLLDKNFKRRRATQSSSFLSMNPQIIKATFTNFSKQILGLALQATILAIVKINFTISTDKS
ncbi:MAG: hypothetical protein IKN27_06635, partial [Selenomonadaceae bacterium]|nr:hypothetical protein [Selenomonadaceae bacterium]